MKSGHNISNFLFRTVVVLGLVIGFLAISFTTPLILTAVENDSVQSEKPGSDTQDQPSEATLKAFEAITSSVQISFSQEFFLIDVLPKMEELTEEEGAEQESVTAGSKVLKILFRRIISPNAP